MGTCPDCGKNTVDWSTYADYCTDPECGWSFSYPSVENARPGTLTPTDRKYAVKNGYTPKERDE